MVMTIEAQFDYVSFLPATCPVTWSVIKLTKMRDQHVMIFAKESEDFRCHLPGIERLPCILRTSLDLDLGEKTNERKDTFKPVLLQVLTPMQWKFPEEQFKEFHVKIHSTKSQFGSQHPFSAVDPKEKKHSTFLEE